MPERSPSAAAAERAWRRGREAEAYTAVSGSRRARAPAPATPAAAARRSAARRPPRRSILEESRGSLAGSAGLAHTRRASRRSSRRREASFCVGKGKEMGLFLRSAGSCGLCRSKYTMGLFWACWRYTNENFFFFTFFHLKFAKIYGLKKMQNYTSGAVTAAGTYRREEARGNVAPSYRLGARR